MNEYPISVSMTPSFFDAEHIMLRAQLKCLAAQTVRDFDVWLIDPHYQKRKAVVPELAQRFQLDIKHVPYTPCTRIAKYFDCAIFNAAYCYSPAPLNLRYSCYRFVRPSLIERILATPGVNVDLYMNAVGPDLTESGEPHVKHLSVWNFDSEDVDWQRFPTSSGYRKGGDRLGNWPAFMDSDKASPVDVTLDIYGNIAWRRSQWFDLNGTNEVITNAAHWEDLDFDCRASIAGQKVVRYGHLLYRLHHCYGSYSQRANVQVDVPLKKICGACYESVFCNSGDSDFGKHLNKRIHNSEVEVYDYCQVWVCKTCGLSGAIFGAAGLDGYFEKIRSYGLTKSPILPKEKIGRNLRILAERMDKAERLEQKVEIYNDSWDNQDYYQT